MSKYQNSCPKNNFLRGNEMTDKELWRQMENLSNEEPSIEREMRFMHLLKKAYDKDMKLIMACVYDPMMPGLARQGYMEVEGKRMLVCFTSKQRAKTADYNTTWDVAKAKELMNNMFNKSSVAGMVFNPNDKKMLIVFKELLLQIMPGEKPKPEFYRE